MCIVFIYYLFFMIIMCFPSFKKNHLEAISFALHKKRSFSCHRHIDTSVSTSERRHAASWGRQRIIHSSRTNGWGEIPPNFLARATPWKASGSLAPRLCHARINSVESPDVFYISFLSRIFKIHRMCETARFIEKNTKEKLWRNLR